MIDGRVAARILQYLLAGAGLLLASQALAPLYVDIVAAEEGDLSGGNVRFQILSLGIYALAFGFLLARVPTVVELIRRNPLLLATTLFCVASFLWSVEPDTSLRRGFALLLSTGFAFFVVAHFRPDQLLRILAVVLLIAGALSLLVIFGMPALGRHQTVNHYGVWRGTFGHKNTMGRVMAIGVLLFLALRRDPGMPRWLTYAGIALCGLLLAGSQSRTSWATAGLVVLLSPLLGLLRNPRVTLRLRFLVVFGLGLAALLGAAALVQAVVTAMGRDLTFSGRTTLWQYAIAAGMDNHPVLGAGYRAFWTEAGADEVYRRIAHWNSVVGNGHNGYLDVWLELGVVGLALVVALVIGTAVRAVRRLINNQDIYGLFYVYVVIFLVVYSLPEKMILQQTELVWMLFTMTVLYTTPLPAPAAGG